MLGNGGAAVQVDDRRAIDDAHDRLIIRELLENWIIWRDSGDWNRFATVWHDDGRMIASWFQAGAAEFIAGCRKAFDSGICSFHSALGSSIDVQGNRAVAQTKMQIIQRGVVDDITVDVTCFGRFVDALEKRNGRWGIVLRQPVYELDDMTVVTPGQMPKLDHEILQAFPHGYRHLAYMQTKLGFAVSKTLPGTRGPEIEMLNAQMKRWLVGDDAPWLLS